MASTKTPPGPTPDRTDPIGDSYAIFVTDQTLHVWQYQHSISAPDGEWRFIETFVHENGPKLSLSQATLTAPTPEGYWVYTTEYDCVLGCN